MLLHHARRASRTGPGGRLVPLGEQDRSRWDTGLITEGVTILQAALARDRLGEYQAQAAIAALHADARSTSETDWVQIVEWYDELLLLTGSPVVHDGADKIAGRRITVYLNTGKSVVEGARAVIFPHQAENRDNGVRADHVR